MSRNKDFTCDQCGAQMADVKADSFLTKSPSVVYPEDVLAYLPVIEAENAKLRELCADMLWTIKHAHGWYKNDTHEMLMTDVRGRDGEPTNVSHSLTTDEEMYEKRMRELGIEVEE